MIGRLLILILCILATEIHAQLVTGKVVSIADGDTFTMLVGTDQIRVRLHGVDCPEKGQPFSNVARKRLSDLVYGIEVECEQLDVDRYGRMVAVVYTPSDSCVNEILLREGLAWHYKRYDSNPFWASLEDSAKALKLGIWADPNAVSPHVYRSANRAK